MVWDYLKLKCPSSCIILWGCLPPPPPHPIPSTRQICLREHGIGNLTTLCAINTNMKLSFPFLSAFLLPQASIVTVIQLVNNVVDTIENEGI